MKRIIGQYGGLRPGPLVIMIGAIHGNEPAGVQALQEVFKQLNEADPARQLAPFQGKLIGIIGHCQAFQTGQRFLEQDLNRMWLSATVRQILAKNRKDLREEELEIRELCDLIQEAVQANLPETLVILDLHTTSAAGGVFCIPTDEMASLDLARALHAPVILDLLKGIQGPLLAYAAEGNFVQDGWPRQTLGVAFEAGQHVNPHSVSRSTSAAMHCLRAVGCLPMEGPEQDFDRILEQYSAGLPKVSRLLHVHRVQPGDQFRMRPGYLNFQRVRKGEHLADDVRGAVQAPCDGLILMPLYQSQGSDGFFLVGPEEE
ncbi:MAG: succinylglutamate desuccinylase/aspartoacylase family protein [Saprospiraceae bacterium]